jgi:xanthine dehydrogenase accessory factor
VKLHSLQRLNEARRKRLAAITVTDIASGASRLIIEKDGYAGDPLEAEIADRFRSGASGLADGGKSFVTVHLPSPQFVLIGAVHISQALAPMAKLAGFDVTIIDPRTAFATADRFPDVRLIAEWPQDVIPARLALDPFTALAVLAHDPKIDDGPLIEALRVGCFYIGALGSRKTHARRIERLREQGFDDAALAAIHAPIGISIGARSPAEIAVAVLAQVIGALRSRGMAAKEAAA